VAPTTITYRGVPSKEGWPREYQLVAVWLAVAGASCGGGIRSSEKGTRGGSDGTADADSQFGEQPNEDGANVENGLDAESRDEIRPDATAISNGTLVCGYHTGPLPAGADAGGPYVVCNAGWMCTNLNGGWACCTIVSAAGGGISNCMLPFFKDGGM
jgi:hypothetical protein